MNKYKTTYGLWQVTTEGDVEGKSTTQLGTHEGYIDEIALHLADKQFYGLTFKQIKPIEKFEPTRSKVNVQLAIDSGTWDTGREQLAAEMREFFADRPVHIEPCNYYASFTITTEKDIRAEDIRRAKAKLTDYEKELLGVK
jgi:hypothetical protein